MINIENYLSTEEFKSKEELAKETGLSERCIRKKISELKLTRPVIFNSYTKGYRLAKDFSKLTKTEILEEMNLIQHSINDMQARKKVFDKQLRSYIAYEKSAEKFLA